MSKDKRPVQTVMKKRMQPMDANSEGNVFGGSILKYVDEVGSIVAERYAGKRVVTASIDRMSFHQPVYLGDLLLLDASLDYVGNTSMTVSVDVYAEDLRKGKRRHTGSAYATYVALDEDGEPTSVPGLKIQTEEEKKRAKKAKEWKDRIIEELEEDR